MRPDYDVLIIGGGLVGASLACALRVSDLRIGVIETAPLAVSSSPSYDDRTLALAYGSKRIFESMDVWQAIAPEAAPIERIHISDRGHFGAARLSALEARLPSLGYVVPNRALGAALLKILQTTQHIDWLCPAEMRGIRFTPGLASVTVCHNAVDKTLTTHLVIAADGAHSAVRQACGIEAVSTEYRQTAVMTNVTPNQLHHNTAYERFTDTGPLALLPRRDNACAVVWSVHEEQVPAMLGWSNEEFLRQLQERFGDRLGRFTRVGQRATYPLARTRVREHVRARLALIGNAAHTVHPVAGQGFNLGLRDVAALAEVLQNAVRAGEDIGDLRVLQRYAVWRQRDNQVTSLFTNSLVRIFSNQIFPLTVVRSAGLIAVDLIPGAKRGFIRITSGLAGKLPRLARGLAL
ncbi:MAG: 2-octaprenyl-6-methoxyphenyl hydroxylase [Sulfuricaulis sp.]